MAVVALLAAIICSSAAPAADDVRVRFSWKLKGEYGHLYLAQDQGFYAAKNLAVRSGQVRRYEACVSFAFTYVAVRASTGETRAAILDELARGAFCCIAASDQPEVTLRKRLRARIRL